MNHQVMDLVWTRSRSSGIERLVLLAVASQQVDESETFISVATLLELSNCSERTVYRAIRSLEKSGELFVRRTPGAESAYHVLVGKAQS